MRRSRLMVHGITAVIVCGATVSLALPPAAASSPSVGTDRDVSLASGADPLDDEAALRPALRAVVDAGATGAVGRVDDGEDVSAVAVGEAQLGTGSRLRLTDQVRVGSVTKTVIAAITLQLVGEGLLRLNDTVQKWLPGMVPNGKAITIRMLLRHTSGIFDYVSDADWLAAVFAHPHYDWSPQELVAVATAHPPTFPPGKGLAYSNTGYILVGLILKRATGQSLHDLVSQRVVQPLGLRRTYFATSAQFSGPYAHGYFPPSFTGDGYVDTSSWSPSIGWAAGGLVSTAPDLARIYQALLSGRLLSQRLLDMMTRTVSGPAYPGIRIGLGIWAVETKCGTVWGHEGGIPGYKSFALTNRAGTRSGVVIVPTELDQAIGAAFEAAVATAACQMYDRDSVA